MKRSGKRYQRPVNCRRVRQSLQSLLGLPTQYRRCDCSPELIRPTSRSSLMHHLPRRFPAIVVRSAMGTARKSRSIQSLIYPFLYLCLSRSPPISFFQSYRQRHICHGALISLVWHLLRLASIGTASRTGGALRSIPGHAASGYAE